MTTTSVKKHILPIIVLAQFCCVSLWFAGNAVMNDLAQTFSLDSNAGTHLTSAVQFGFIGGTLAFAFLSISDRFSPSKVFFFCALAGAGFNVMTLLETNTITTLILIRFLVGFCLAGIYPVGMKIAADYFEKGLGKSLGFLVGALVLGTAFPHFLKNIAQHYDISWQSVLINASALAFFGGLILISLVPDGPYRKTSSKFDIKTISKIFVSKNFRSAAFGYFGHMWELYAFWVFLPFIITIFNTRNPDSLLNTSLWSFMIIGIGTIACIGAGYLSQKFGSKKIAFIALFSSFICCLVSPMILTSGSTFLLLTFLCFWGMVVIADSPLFSTLVAQNAPAESKGTALTIVNCIGFSITILSIQLISYLKDTLPHQYLFLFLAIGPLLGLIALKKKQQPKSKQPKHTT